MKLLPLLIASIFFPFSLSAQTPISSFPQSWYGVWAGTLEIYQAKGKSMEVQMELRIAPTDSSHRWNWTLLYVRDTIRDERQYELVAIDPALGHYQIDERNSILLDSYLLHHVLSARFAVGNSLLLTNYHFESDQITFEIFIGGRKEAKRTGKTGEEVGEIFSYPVGTMQRAVLRRK